MLTVEGQHVKPETLSITRGKSRVDEVVWEV
jgi:hypothetical protein